MRWLWVFFTCFFWVTKLQAVGVQAETQPQPAFDSQAAWQEVRQLLQQQYAYIDHAPQAAASLIAWFEPIALQSRSEAEFRDICQQLMRNFTDPHLNMGPYDRDDWSVYPTGSDVFIRYLDGKFLVADVKAGSAAASIGVRTGMELIAINNIVVPVLVEQLLGRPFASLHPEQIQYAANIAAGGKRYQSRKLTLQQNMSKDTMQLQLAPSYDVIKKLEQGPVISTKRFGQIGYIRFENSLGNDQTAAAFASALAGFADTEALIIDLRNTPSGGNTGVAEPILGHFVQKPASYQHYRSQTASQSYQQAELIKRMVYPTPPSYQKPVLVLAGHWTGSMGEGMTIGLKALGAQAVLGAPMADLLGGIKQHSLTHSNSWLEFGFERLYQTNGQFREDFVPEVLVEPADLNSMGADPALGAALRLAERNSKAAKTQVAQPDRTAVEN